MPKGIYLRTKQVWNKGKKGLQKHSEDDKIRISKIMKEWWFKNKESKVIKERNIRIGKANSRSLLNKHCSPRTEFKKDRTPWNKNIRMSEEFREKCRKRHNKIIGWDKRLEERRRFVLPKKDTSIEVKIQNFLKELGISFFTHQYIKEIEHGYQCDILIPSMNMVIECDGDYWHKYPIGKEIDKIRTKELLEKGFKVLRLWEHEIKYLDLTKFRDKLYP